MSTAGRGPQKWHDDKQGQVVIDKFNAYRDGDEDGWDPAHSDAKAARRGGPPDPVKLWWEEVKNGDQQLWGNINLTMWRKHVAKIGKKYIANSNNPFDDARADDGADRAPTATASRDQNSNGGQTTGVSDQTIENQGLQLHFKQVMFDISSDGGGETRKGIHIVIQHPSGWSIGQEQNRGDFFALSPDGQTLTLSLSSSPRLFNRTAAENLLVRNAAFRNTYASQSGVEHTAVTAMRAAISAQMPSGEIPKREMKIQLLAPCSRIVALEFLHNRDRTRGRLVPNTQCAPAGLYYAQDGTHWPTGTIQLELEVKVETSESLLAQEFVPQLVSSPKAPPGGASTTPSQAGTGGRPQGGGPANNATPTTGNNRGQGRGEQSATCVPGEDPPTHDNDDGKSGAQDPPAVSGGDPFSMASLRDGLRDVLNEAGVTGLSERVSSLEKDMGPIKKTFDLFVEEFTEEGEGAEAGMSMILEMALKKLNRVDKGLVKLGTASKNMLETVEGYRRMLIQVKDEGHRREKLFKDLSTNGAKLKEWAEGKFESLDNRVGEVEGKADDVQTIIEKGLEDAKAEIDLLLENRLNETVDMKDINQVLGLDAEDDERDLLEGFQRHLDKLEATFREDLARSKKMYDLCVDLLRAGKISLPTESPTAVTPQRNKVGCDEFDWN